MADTVSKLAHLLPHWVEHNDAHLDGFRKWAEQARGSGLERVADRLSEAVGFIEQANDALRKAQQHLEK